MVTIREILVPTDLSDASVPAVGYAISLAKKHGAEVAVLHVFPVKEMREQFAERYVADGLIASTQAPIASRHPLDLDSILEAKKRLLHDFLREKIAAEILKGVKVNPLIRFGKAVEEVVAAAKEEQSDLIVMTSHRSALARLFRGSFTDQVARRAPCPVLTIQPSVEIRTEEDNRVPVRFIDKWAA